MKRVNSGPLLVKFAHINKNYGMWISGDNIVTTKVYLSLKNTKISK